MIAIVVWFYSFFHANHLAGLSDEEFDQVKDDYLMGMEGIPGVRSVIDKNYKWVAGVLIFLGVCFLWNSIEDLLRDILPEAYKFIPRMMWRIGNYIPSLVIGVGIIYIGVKMIKGKERSLIEEHDDQDSGEGSGF